MNISTEIGTNPWRFLLNSGVAKFQKIHTKVSVKSFKKASSATTRSAEEAFINFIVNTASHSVFRDDLKWQIENFQSKNHDQKLKLLPGFYLFVERYIFNSMETSQRTFREVLYQQFQFVIDQMPYLKIIFLPREEQIIEIYRHFLASLARKSQAHSKSARSAASLTANINACYAATAHNPSVNNREWVQLSHHYYFELSQLIGEKATLKLYNEVYQKYSLRYQNLDSFAEILQLFPNQALDETKYNLLSIQQMKNLLAEKVEKLELVSQELVEKNQLLRNTNEELAAQSEQLNTQNMRLTDAQSLIEMMNDELKSYNRRLESKVLDRTKELEESNEMLRQHNQSLEQYTFTISHQLKAPVARILGLTNLLTMVPPQEIATVSKSVHASAKELESIFKELVQSLNLTKESAETKPEKLNLTSVLHSIWNDVSKKYATSARINVANNALNEIVADKNHVSQALQHLLDNAAKFSQTASTPIIDVTLTEKDDELEIVVKDNGIGFSTEEHHKKLFTPYQRLNQTFDGRGMGLYLTKQHLSIVGGNIQLTSSPNKGTEVRIGLPFKKNTAVNAK